MEPENVTDSLEIDWHMETVFTRFISTPDSNRLGRVKLSIIKYFTQSLSLAENIGSLKGFLHDFTLTLFHRRDWNTCIKTA